MEEWVRVRNERDRKVLAWLRGQVGEAAIVAAAQACTRGARNRIYRRSVGSSDCRRRIYQTEEARLPKQ
jgi:hypothetical protein